MTTQTRVRLRKPKHRETTYWSFVGVLLVVMFLTALIEMY